MIHGNGSMQRIWIPEIQEVKEIHINTIVGSTSGREWANNTIIVSMAYILEAIDFFEKAFILESIVKYLLKSNNLEIF